VSQVLMRASSRLHDWLLSAVLRAPVSFFDLTPRGRVVNRFSRDMDESTIPTSPLYLCFTILGSRHKQRHFSRHAAMGNS